MPSNKSADLRELASERRLRAQIAANERWARVTDRSAETAAARRGLDEKFARDVDPEGVLAPQELAARVAAVRRAHFLRMSLKSAKARRKRRQAAEEHHPGADDGTPPAA